MASVRRDDVITRPDARHQSRSPSSGDEGQPVIEERCAKHVAFARAAGEQRRSHMASVRGRSKDQKA